MALLLNDPLTPARDHFERYYAEKIWEWIPGIYKHEDGLATNPDVLRAIVEILARQAAVSRRSIDRLWEDQYIDFADDWAISYIGDLVGTRLVHELNRRGRRTDVARTLFYRRRKGTPLVMESLIRDITGWDGVVVEGFRRLTRTRHRLDPEPIGLQGPVTFTPPGGFADLRRTRGRDLVDGPFDEYFHTPDFRRLAGFKGRYNISKLNFHLYRLSAFPVRLATPFDFGARRLTFDPSGRDIPLFRPRQRPPGDEWRKVNEWEITGPIPCRLLGAAAYQLQAGAVPAGLESEMAPLLGQRIVDEARLRQTLDALFDPPPPESSMADILSQAITGDSPKLHLIPEAIAVSVGEDSDVTPFQHHQITSGNLVDWVAPTELKPLVIDPVRGRLLLIEDPAPDERVFVPLYHYGFSGPIGAGTYSRTGAVAIDDNVSALTEGTLTDPGPVENFSIPNDGTHEFVNSKTYVPNTPPDNTVSEIERLCLQARDRERPYIRLVPGDSAREWVFRSQDIPENADPEDEANRRLLILEGLWLGIIPSDLASQVLVDVADSCDPVPTSLVLDGVFDRVTIRHCTLDPGGEQARLEPLECTPIPLVALEVRGQIEELIIEHSIVGPVREITNDFDPCSIGKFIIRDSIVHNLQPETPAITTRVGEVHLERSTVFGDVVVNRLFASEALIQGEVRVTDNQHGCFRFSAAGRSDQQRLPAQFESHLFDAGIANHFFVSRRFSDPGYAQLSDSAPDEIRRGAENRSEMGAFSSLLNPIKRDDLKAKVNEFMPFGLIAQYINET